MSFTQSTLIADDGAKAHATKVILSIAGSEKPSKENKQLASDGLRALLKENTIIPTALEWNDKHELLLKLSPLGKALIIKSINPPLAK